MQEVEGQEGEALEIKTGGGTGADGCVDADAVEEMADTRGVVTMRCRYQTRDGGTGRIVKCC